jgi:hypothetical protein
MNYRKADDLVFGILRDGTSMFATVRETAFPQTYRAMSMRKRKGSSLSNGGHWASRTSYARRRFTNSLSTGRIGSRHLHSDGCASRK